MTGTRFSAPAALAALAVFGAAPGYAAGPGRKTVARADCSFQANPDEFLSRQSRVRLEVFERAARFEATSARAAERAPAQIPVRNFIDSEIFGQLARAGVQPAKLSTDEEFFRRIHLDLTGRLPSPDEVRAFLSDTAPAKRDAVIDRLLQSPEFIDRWTMWFGDLFQNNAFATNVSRQIGGRNAYYAWIRNSVASNKSLHDLAWEAIAFSGNDYNPDTGMVNFAVGAITPMGPIQDTYDAMLVKSAATFLGMGHCDCLLCHSGRGHLDQVSLWGARTTRAEAERMAAFFSRTRLIRNPAQKDQPLYQSYDVYDAPAGAYALNTNYGNRPARAPLGPDQSLTPQYRTGATPSGGNWRAAFADNLTQDRMFARNMVNRVWKYFFGLGLVDPVETLDPDRLEPGNPPPAPWSFQATHPALLESLAVEFERSWYDLRALIRLLAQSSAYQLSSRYDGEWKLDYVPLFARHCPRRLEGEEVHDAVAKAAGVPGGYAVQGWAEPVLWAVQLPEPVEPRSNGAVAAFMNAFLRGNRDTQPRSQAGSILQQLNLMNDAFVLNRIKVAASPVVQQIAKISSDDAALEELFLRFLARRPTEAERARGLALLAGAATVQARNAAIEDLAWAAINKLEFLFSY